MTLARTSLYTSISTAITFISGFIVTKVVAVKIGASGMAYYGQYLNTTTILSLFAMGGIGAGIIKYMAEYSGDIEKQQRVIKTSLSLVIICSLIVSLSVIAFSGALSRAAFHTSEFWSVYLLYGFFVTVIACNTWFASIYNGLKEIKKLTIVNISGSLAGLAFTTYFAYTSGVKGVLIASNFMAIVVLIFNLYFAGKFPQFKWLPDLRKWDKKFMQLFFHFTLMALASGILGPLVQILVRDRIINTVTLEDAGIWQGVTRISDYYLGFITTVLAVYYLPRLSEITERAELRKEIFKGYKTILPIVIGLAMVIWISRDLIIEILFTESFKPMRPLFTFQLIGDVLKIGSWLITYIMISKALVRTFIISEITFCALYVLLSWFFIRQYGVIGATYGFCLNYGLYWLTMSLVLKKHVL